MSSSRIPAGMYAYNISQIYFFQYFLWAFHTKRTHFVDHKRFLCVPATMACRCLIIYRWHAVA